jgi:hypothetical protein
MNKIIKILIIFVLFFLILSCGIPEYNRPWYKIYYDNPKDYELKTIDNIIFYVNEIIKYKSQNLVHHPQINIDTHEADCVGISLVALAMIYKELKIKGSLLKYNVVGSGKLESHICFKIDNKIYYKKLKYGYCTDLILEIPFDKIEVAYRFIF